MAALHFLITGRVQGVGFRYAMCVEARRMGIAGWVRNLADGSVEAVAIGDANALQLLAKWARHGPPASKVERVHASEIADAPSIEVDRPFVQRPSA